MATQRQPCANCAKPVGDGTNFWLEMYEGVEQRGSYDLCSFHCLLAFAFKKQDEQPKLSKSKREEP